MLPGFAACLCVLCVCRSPHRTTPPTPSPHPRPLQLRITQPRPSLPKIRIIPAVARVRYKRTFRAEDVNRRARPHTAPAHIDRSILRVTLAKPSQVRRLRMLRAKLLKRAAPRRPRHRRRHQRLPAAHHLAMTESIRNISRQRTARQINVENSPAQQTARTLLEICTRGPRLCAQSMPSAPILLASRHTFCENAHRWPVTESPSLSARESGGS